jgi:hypothetical protein
MVGGAVAGMGGSGRAALTAPLINCRFEEIFMRGVVMHRPGDVSVEERERPQIVEPTDAIIRIPASCICGSDQHAAESGSSFRSRAGLRPA